YSSSDEYMALYLAALSAVGAGTVEMVTTGLPVRHWADKKRRDALAKSLTGRHYIRADLTVDVHAVQVLPQPAGTYATVAVEGSPPAAAGEKRQGIRRDNTVLVVDPGHFSFDWVLLRSGIQERSSGNSN